MSFTFNGKEFEVKEEKGKKKVRRKTFLDRTREETFSYEMLRLLNTLYGKELLARADEALRIETYCIFNGLTENLELARENIYYRFKEIDNFLNEEM